MCSIIYHVQCSEPLKLDEVYIYLSIEVGILGSLVTQYRFTLYESSHMACNSIRLIPASLMFHELQNPSKKP